MISQATSVLSPASPQGREVLGLFWFTLGIAGMIFLVVTALVLIAVVRFRERPGGPPPSTREGNLPLEVIWTLIPTLILAVLFIFTVRVMHEVEAKPRDGPVDLEIIAHQWWWELHYPQYGVTTANEFHLPVQRQLLLRLKSADVVHDFWVPALGKKVDAIPQHPNLLTLTIDRPGTYLGTCDEFCGAEHAWMRIRVIGQTEKDFEDWARRQAEPAARPSTPAARRGSELFQRRTCASCHTMAGTKARGRVGPDLTHVASRQTLASGALQNSPESLSRWIADPQAIKPGCQMPDLHLDPSEVKSITAYLEELR